VLLIGTENPVGFRVDSPGFDMDLEREREREMGCSALAYLGQWSWIGFDKLLLSFFPAFLSANVNLPLATLPIFSVNLLK